MYTKRSYNLCSTYILPLVGLNRWSFGAPENFVDSYINQDNSYVVVKLKSVTVAVTAIPSFKFKFERDNESYAVFEIPERFRDCVDKFREGKYSQFSDAAKLTIRKKSGLRYKAPQANGTVRSARELLALDKDRELRKAIERELSNPGSPVVISEEAELMSIPDKNNFIDLSFNKVIPVEEAIN